MKRFAIVFMLCVSSAWSQTPNPVIGGIPVHCTDSTDSTVFTAMSTSIRDVAQSTISPTGLRLIVLNPGPLARMPALLQQFVYAHECGHHISGDVVAAAYMGHDDLGREQTADRIGIRLLRDQLHISKGDADWIANTFVQNPAMPPYYLPGPLRARWISACYSTDTDDCGSNTNYASNDSTGSFCLALKKVVADSPSRFRNLRGQRDVAGGYSVTVSLSDHCSLLPPSLHYYCKLPSTADFTEVASDVTDCLTGWTRRDIAGDRGLITYTKDNAATEVDVHERKDGLIAVSVMEGP